jgi:hypothetical protein
LGNVFVTCPRRAFGPRRSSGACAAAAADRKESCGRVHELDSIFLDTDASKLAALVLIALRRVLELDKGLHCGLSGRTGLALRASFALRARWAFVRV